MGSITKSVETKNRAKVGREMHELLGQLLVTDSIVFQDFYISCVTDSIDYG